MSKTFILDTNVLLFDPQSVLKFGKNKVFIPLVVVEELDRFKKDQNENGRNARQFARLVDKLRAEGSLTKGVELENGGKLFIGITKQPQLEGNYGIDLNQNDNKILLSALSLSQDGEDATLITKDINLRLKSDAIELALKIMKQQM